MATEEGEAGPLVQTALMSTALTTMKSTALDWNVERIVMRRRQERLGDCGGDKSSAGIDRDVRARQPIQRSAVEANLRTGNEVSTKNLDASKIRSGSQSSLGNQGLGNTADDARTGRRTGNQEFRDFGGLQGVRGTRAEIHYLDHVAPGLGDKGLVGRGIDDNATGQSQRAGRVVGNRESHRTGSRRTKIDDGIALRGIRIGNRQLIDRT